MLSGVVGAILGLIGGVAAILALLSKELENKPTIKYVIVAALFGLMLYAMIGSIFAINSSATDTTSSGGGNNGNTNLSATITTQETELANLRATMASGREAASLVTQAPITQIAVTQVSVTQIAVTEVAVTQVAVTQVVQPPVAADATLSPSAAQPSTNIPVGFEKRTSAGDILFGIDNVNIFT